MLDSKRKKDTEWSSPAGPGQPTSQWGGSTQGVDEACMLTRGLRLLMAAKEAKR